MTTTETRMEEIRQKVIAEGEKNAIEMAAKAKYKIQIFFQSTRSDKGPIAFSLSVWESGKRLHGGGDECIFICKRQAGVTRVPFGVMGAVPANPNGCGGFISGDFERGGYVICPHCELKWATTEIGDSIFYRLTASAAAEVLAKTWRQLGCNADIYAKYRPDDIRVTTMRQAEGLAKARKLKGMTIYPLKNIIKDTTDGASVEARFKAFILA